jgi:glucose/arabinose dehydrogenase
MRIVTLVAAIALVSATAIWWDEIEDALDRIRPDRAFSAAESRTSEAAPFAADDVPLPQPADATRAAGTDPAIRLERVSDLESPTALADPPGDGPVLVATQGGVLYALDLATGDATAVLDLTARITAGGERGLLGLAVDAAGERVYTAFTNADGDVEVRSWALDPADPRGDLDPDSGLLHLTIGKPYANHNGGHLVFGPDGALWIGTGDGGGSNDPGRTAQRADRVLGKMLRVIPDPDGGVGAPRSNPDWGGRSEVWAIGLRNPWRYSFDRATNRLWVADVGQNSVEEVSVVDPDHPRPNFGWSEVEGSNALNGETDDSFIAPVVEYSHADGCSVTGGYVYRGSALPGLYGWYLFGDYCGRWVRAVPSDDPTAEPIELLRDAGSIMSFGELEDGELLVLSGGGVYAVVEG